MLNTAPHYPANTLPCKHFQLAIFCHHLLSVMNSTHMMTHIYKTFTA